MHNFPFQTLDIFTLKKARHFFLNNHNMTSINILVILGLLSLSSIIKAVPVIDSADKGEQKRSIASGKYIYL